ncbi:GNAT family N-acetyltransferase [Undibacterium sp. TJN25]|uniref:GNAT family N-acetyltransferase n=1 Tax=Undibacterium sp. TJN25 TaxID=3413056 RepID=UPI003BF27BE3
MTHILNPLGQPIGLPLASWSPRELPPATVMAGRYCRIEVLDVERHAEQLFRANSDDTDGSHWTYLMAEPPADFNAYRQWLLGVSGLADPMLHAIIDQASGQALGVAAFMRIDRNSGVIEVGNINFSPRLQRTRASTEAMFLMMRRVFDELGYRRYEWKCDSLNAPSRAAALRYGFQFEGIFRQAVVLKQRNRDTAWFSMLDSEWAQLKQAYEQWLNPDNFDAGGQQKRSLGELKQAVGAGRA